MTEAEVALPPLSIALVGIGCQFPGAPDRAAYWANVRDGVDAIGEIPASHFAIDDFYDPDPKAPDRIYVRRGGFLTPVAFDALRWGIAPRDIEATDTTQLLGLMVAQAALDDADYGPGRRALPQERTSVILGVTGALELVIPLGARLGHPHWRRALRDAGVDDDTAADVIARIGERYVPWQENSFPGLLGNVAAGRIANRLDLHGTNCVVDAACASSLSAVHLGILELESGRADVVLAGGIDTFNDVFMYMCFSKTPALSPSGDARPFDADGDGTILGEGLGMVVLKRLADAERDGDRIYAVLRGMGTSSDGRGQAIYAPVADGQARALRRAYAQAGIAPREVGLLEAHGTGTKVGDATEVEALRAVFESTAHEGPWCALGSVKSMIGHTKAAAGAAGLIKAALAVYHRTLPPTLKVRRPNPAIERDDPPFFLAPRRRPWPSPSHPRRAGVSAFGFGGSNFHCVIEQHGTGCPDPDWDDRLEIAAVDAASQDALQARLATLTPAQARASRATFDASARHRCAFVWRDAEEFEAQRRNAHAHLSTGAPLCDTVSVGTGPAPRVGVLFAGQGAQRIGMLADLRAAFPEATAALEAAGPQVAARLDPPPRFDPAATAADDLALRATEIAQPALGAVSWGMWQVLQRFGLRPEAAAGHSFGELVALTAAGCLPASALPRVSAARGRCMAEAARGPDPGGMLAVSWTLDALEAWRAEEAPTLVLANRNAPRQGVLSGPRDAIEAAQVRLRARGIASTLLAVGAGFHSPIVAPAADAFRRELADLPWGAATFTVYANASAAPYPSDPEHARDTLGRQLAAPVDFVGMIERMAADGIDLFVEVGPGRRLSGLVRQILGDDAAVLSLDSGGGDAAGLDALAALLARLAAAGHPVDLAAWNHRTEPRDTLRAPDPARLPILVSGANAKPSVSPRPERARVDPLGVVANTSTSSTLPSVPRNTVPATQASPALRRDDDSRDVALRPRPAFAAAGAPSMPRTLELPMSGTTPFDPLSAFVELQRQTAELHRQFLDAQAEATRVFERLLSGTAAPATASPLEGRRAFEASGVTAPPARNEDAAHLGPRPVARNEDHGSRPVARSEDAAYLGPRPVASVPPEATPLPATANLRSSNASARPTAPDVEARTVGHRPAEGRDVTSTVLHVVAEKTGYPVTMLDPGMGLDADLGIDSIKRVEILSALQEALPDAPIVSAERLADLQTVADIVAALDVASTSSDARTNGAPTRPAPMRAPLPAPAAGRTATASPSSATDALAEVVRSVVAEKTGYPASMLALTMALDADLGIDSIKRVEILSALQEALPHAPIVSSDQAGELRTLADLVAVLAGTKPNDVNAAHVATAVAATPNGGPSGTSPRDVHAISTRADVAAAPNGALADTGPRSVDGPSTAADALAHLNGAHTDTRPRSVDGSGTAADSLAHSNGANTDPRDVDASGAAASPAHSNGASTDPCDVDTSGTAASPAYSNGASTDTRDVDATRAAASPAPASASPLATDLPLTVLAPTRVSWTPGPLRPLSERFWAIVGGDRDQRAHVRLGLRKHGCPVLEDGATPLATEGRALGGWVLLPSTPIEEVRTLQTWWPTFDADTTVAALVRIDGGLGFTDRPKHDPTTGRCAGLLKTLAAERPELRVRILDVSPDLELATAPWIAALRAEGPIERGLDADGAWTIRLAEVSSPPTEGIRWQPSGDDVIVLSGGGRGVTAAVAEQLGRAGAGTLILLGRTAVPIEEPPWLHSLEDEAAIKAMLFEHGGAEATPRAVSGACREILAARDVRRTLAAITATGARAVYREVDLRDKTKVQTAIDRILTEVGPITAIVHGAGVLADRLLPDKRPEDIDRVYATKVQGLTHLLDAVPAMTLRALVLFSSSTARFGRRGQADYAMANEALNKLAQSWAIHAPATRVLSVNWGPWDGGMVTVAHRRIFAEEGVTTIPLVAGAQALLAQLAAPGPVELVVLGPGSAWPTPATDPTSEPAGSDSGVAPEFRPPTPRWSTVLSRSVRLGEHAILEDHVLDGRAVLPIALSVEWMAHVALHDHPGLHLLGIEDLQVLRGVKCATEGALELELAAGPALSAVGETGGTLAVLTELRETAAPTASQRARMLLGARPLRRPEPQYGAVPPLAASSPYGEGVLFHGPQWHALSGVGTIEPDGLWGLAQPAPRPDTWMRHPLRRRWITDPWAIDAGLQLAIVWCHHVLGAPCLPSGWGSYRQFSDAWGPGPIGVRLQVRDHGPGRMIGNLEWTDARGELLARLEGLRSTVDPGLRPAFARSRLANDGARADGPQ